MNLGATQQRTRVAAPSEGLGGDTKPRDVAEDIMSDKPRVGSAPTPGIYSPLEGRGAYSMGERAPGSIATEAEEETLAQKGGAMVTDEGDRALALESAKQQQRALQANMPGAVPLAAGAMAAGAAMGAPGEGGISEGQAEEEEELGEEDIIAEEEEEEAELSQQDQVQQAMQIEALQAQQRQQMAAQGAQAGIKDTLESAKKVEKTLQNMWRVVNAAELLDAEFILPLVMWFLTANLQLINKYTFKVPFIPAASLPEDALTCCTDCFLGSMMCVSLAFQMIIVGFTVIPFAIGGVLVYSIGNWLGLTDALGKFVKHTVAK